MKKVNRKRKSIFALICTIALTFVALNSVAVYADNQQSISCTYTEEMPSSLNEYEISIPSSLDLNTQTDVTIGMKEISDLDDDYAVHVDLDSSTFNGITSYDFFLYPDNGSTSNFMAYRITRISDAVDLHMGGGTYAETDVTAAVFYGDSSRNIGGDIRFNLDSSESRPLNNGSTYSGTVTFNIYGGYE